MANSRTSLSLLATCRRAAGRALGALAGKLLEPERGGAAFADVHEPGVLILPKTICAEIGLHDGFGRVALVHRPGTNLVELMSAATFHWLYRRGIDR